MSSAVKRPRSEAHEIAASHSVLFWRRLGRGAMGAAAGSALIDWLTRWPASSSAHAMPCFIVGQPSGSGRQPSTQLAASFFLLTSCALRLWTASIWSSWWWRVLIGSCPRATRDRTIQRQSNAFMSASWWRGEADMAPAARSCRRWRW